MQTIKQFLKEELANSNVNYFILDSAGDTYEDIDYEEYHYNTRRYNKLKEGDIFLYRKPQSKSSNKQFYIYGGGIVDRIQLVDNDGNVKAIITNSFRFIKPLYQREINISWTFKKKGTTWEHFFSQYGMNLINKLDFLSLVGNLDCIPIDASTYNRAAMAEVSIGIVSDSDEAEEVPEVTDEDIQQFTISSSRNYLSSINLNHIREKSRIYIGKKTDYSKLHNKKKSIGSIGERIVLDLEISHLLQNGREDLAELVEYTAKDSGDGTGYDILSYTLEGKKKFIEVKTTVSNKVYGFEITDNELNFSKDFSYQYELYRIYNLDIKNKKADLKVFEGSVSNWFDLAPTVYRAKLK